MPNYHLCRPCFLLLGPSTIKKWVRDRHNGKPTKSIVAMAQGWRSGESTCLPPMWSWFDSRTRHHTCMWVEFVSPRGFSPGTPVFPSPK